MTAVFRGHQPVVAMIGSRESLCLATGKGGNKLSERRGIVMTVIYFTIWNEHSIVREAVVQT
ncbi:MAG: hypothetical protein WD469_14835 [Paenibacillaceae bacterium]